MNKIANSRNAAICGSLIIEEKGHYYNRFIWIDSDGGRYIYNKRHLFSHADEDLTYTQGTRSLIVEFRTWRIMPLICYDLRFPVWSRNNVGYDILLYTANWPKPRHEAWNTLLRARAIENQAYVAAVNRVGKDANGLEYRGESQFVDFSGKVLANIVDRSGVIFYTLEKAPLNTYRSKYNFLKDADDFEILGLG